MSSDYRPAVTSLQNMILANNGPLINYQSLWTIDLKLSNGRLKTDFLMLSLSL